MECARRFQVMINDIHFDMYPINHIYSLACKNCFIGFSLVVPDQFLPVGSPVEVEGSSVGGMSAGMRYLSYDFAKHFGKKTDGSDYKELLLLPGQYLGIVEGHIRYT